MEKLTRQQRNKINTLFIELSSKTGESRLESIRAIRELLVLYNADPNSYYYKRLENFNLANAVQSDSVRYAGFIKNYIAKVESTPKTILLSRNYTFGKIRMNWRFNNFGKIKAINLTSFNEDGYESILRPVTSSAEYKDNCDLVTADFYHPKTIPERTFLLNSGFRNLDQIIQYQSIIRFGHSLAREILQNVVERMILTEKESKLRRHEIKLSEISGDSHAVAMLRKVAGYHTPVIGNFDEDRLRVYYSPVK